MELYIFENFKMSWNCMYSKISKCHGIVCIQKFQNVMELNIFKNFKMSWNCVYSKISKCHAIVRIQKFMQSVMDAIVFKMSWIQFDGIFSEDI